jgi:hypothetical protein
LTSIADAIAQAKSQANSVPAAVVENVAAPSIVPGRRLTMADLGAQSVTVDNWLQVTEHGIQVAKSADLLDSIDVEIDMNEIVLCYMVRYGKKPPNYRKSYDGVTTVGSSKPWEVTIREAQTFDPECRGQYSAAEIPMTLTGDLNLPKEKKVIEAGTRTGYTTSVTAFAEFQRFYNEVERADLMGQKVLVKVGFKKKTGNGNNWGVITYTLVGPAETN